MRADERSHSGSGDGGSPSGRRTVAIYGGSFDPPHVGHVLAACLVLATEHVDELCVVPVGRHVFGKSLTSFHHRLAMCKLAFATLPQVTVEELEGERAGPSRTIETIWALRERHPDWSLRLVVGADILGELPRWYAIDEIRRLAPLLVLGRRGVDSTEAPPPLLPEISSTELRALLAERERHHEVLERCLPRTVLAYIEEHGLYRS